MLQKTEIERMRAAIEKNVVGSIEVTNGSCVAVDDETGKEYSHKWRNGQTRVYVEPDEDEEVGQNYVFAVRVVLVAVE